MASQFDSRLNAILTKWVIPFLKTYGFKKNRNVFISKGKELSWVIDIQRSQWNDRDKVQFTINCGIYVPKIVSTYLNREEGKNISLTDCCIYSRIGMLAENKLDHWWSLTSSDDLENVDSRIGEDIQNRLKSQGLPFLERLKTINDILKFFEGARREEDRFIFPQSEAICHAYAGIIYSILGETEKSKEAIEAANKASVNSPLESIISNLRNRIEYKI